MPDSALCQAANELARRVLEPFLFNHVMRSCVYAECLGRQRKQPYDRELLYVATILHDLGLTSLAPMQERFEVEGADLAKEFLARQGMSEAALELAWDAIALHTTAGIPVSKATRDLPTRQHESDRLVRLRREPTVAGAKVVRNRGEGSWPLSQLIA